MQTLIGSYQKVEATAQLGKIRHTKDRSILAIELIKDHLFGDKNFKTSEIVFFKLTLGRDSSLYDSQHQFLKTKITMSIERGALYDF